MKRFAPSQGTDAQRRHGPSVTSSTERGEGAGPSSRHGSIIPKHFVTNLGWDDGNEGSWSGGWVSVEDAQGSTGWWVEDGMASLTQEASG